MTEADSGGAPPGTTLEPPRCRCECARQIPAEKFDGCNYQCECLHCPRGDRPGIDRCRYGMTRAIYLRSHGLCPCCTDVPCGLGPPRAPKRKPDGSMADEKDLVEHREAERKRRAREQRWAQERSSGTGSAADSNAQLPGAADEAADEADGAADEADEADAAADEADEADLTPSPPPCCLILPLASLAAMSAHHPCQELPGRHGRHPHLLLGRPGV